MQAGEVIWLLAGIGIGLTVAMLILAGVLVVDGQRLKRRLTLASVADEAPRPAPMPRAAAVPAAPRPLAEARPRPVAPPAPAVPPPPPAPPRTVEPIVADPRMVEPATAVVEEMMSDLAAEIARVQTPEPVVVEVLPATEPARVVAEPVAPTPVPEPPPVPTVPVIE